MVALPALDDPINVNSSFPNVLGPVLLMVALAAVLAPVKLTDPPLIVARPALAKLSNSTEPVPLETLMVAVPAVLEFEKNRGPEDTLKLTLPAAVSGPAVECHYGIFDGEGLRAGRIIGNAGAVDKENSIDVK